MRDNVPLPLIMCIFTLKSTILETDSAAGANAFAGSALDANLRVDGILFTLMNSPYRALINTCTARYAVR